MANGFEIMLKSMLGIDPQDFKTKLEEGMKLLKNTLGHFDKRLTDQEAKISALIDQNSQLMEYLKGKDHGEKGNKARGSNGKFLPGKRANDTADLAGQPESPGKSPVNDASNG